MSSFGFAFILKHLYKKHIETGNDASLNEKNNTKIASRTG